MEIGMWYCIAALWFAESTAGSESHSWAEVDGCVTQIWLAGVVVVVLVGKFTSTVGFWFHTFVCWLSKDDRRWIQSFKHFDFSTPQNWEMILNMNLAHAYQNGWNKTTEIQSKISSNFERPWPWIPRQAQAVEIVKNTVKSLGWVGANPQKTGEDRRKVPKGSKIQWKFVYMCLQRRTTCQTMRYLCWLSIVHQSFDCPNHQPG